MPSKTPSEALAALVTQRYPIAEAIWEDFWTRLGEKALHPGEALAVLSSLTTRMPDPESVSALMASLRARNPRADPPARPTVNIVGTGGGPSTFNLSTASAFVAASIGARVIKTGSRAYASKTGSVDLLDRLGVKQTSSAEQTEEMLATHGIACAGPFVYPRELRLLARQILPFDMKTVGRFFNLVGPFLAAVPVTMQITGVSDHFVLPTFRQLTSDDDTRRYWLVWNDIGCDELLAVTTCHVFDSGEGREFTIEPGEHGLGGEFAELAPVENLDDTVPNFLDLISGRGPRGAIGSIQLNAAAMALAAEAQPDWATAMRAAEESMQAGEPVRLIERIKAGAAAPAA